MNIYLYKMTNELHRQFFQDFTNDPDIYSGINHFSKYIYCEADADARWERQKKLNRIHLSIMLGQESIGEIILKDLDAEKGTLSIHMKNDAFQNHGYGTRAEFLTLDYAFYTLGLQTVFADVIHKNRRSRMFWKRSDFRKPTSMNSLRITDVIKKPGAARSIIICVPKSDSLISLDIITQIRYERNKIFILLRSWETKKKAEVAPANLCALHSAPEPLQALPLGHRDRAHSQQNIGFVSLGCPFSFLT